MKLPFHMHGTRSRKQSTLSWSKSSPAPVSKAAPPAQNILTDEHLPPFSMDSHHATVTWLCALLYLFSGICQPLIMAQAKQAGLADPSAQLYMFCYYLGPSLLVVSLCSSSAPQWPTNKLVISASSVAVVDIVAQGLNYTGAALAGPTVFSIIYSSVTIWTAVFSRMILHRSLFFWQWIAVLFVFGGLAITALDSARLGPDVVFGTAMIVMGSIMHGATYVMSEAIMTATHEQLTVRQNAALQGSVACIALGAWQLIYTMPRFDALVLVPMERAGSSAMLAIAIMAAFGIANLIHSLAFSHTLKYFPGGATSAGVMKGLQAVLVYVASDIIYCGRIGGSEMCFTRTKFVSLIVVSSGVLCFGLLNNSQRYKAGYARINSYAGTEADMVV